MANRLKDRFLNSSLEPNVKNKMKFGMKIPSVNCFNVVDKFSQPNLTQINSHEIKNIFSRAGAYIPIAYTLTTFK